MFVTKRKYNKLREQYKKEFAEFNILKMENQILAEDNKELAEENERYYAALGNQEASIQEILIEDAEMEEMLYRYERYGFPVCILIGLLIGYFVR